MTSFEQPRAVDPFGRTQMPSTDDEQSWTPPPAGSQQELTGQPAIRPQLPIATPIVPQPTIASSPAAPLSMAAP